MCAKGLTPIATAQEPINKQFSEAVNFRPSDFNDAVLGKGYDVLHEKALRCPCVSKENGTALPHCQNCGSSGFFYVEQRRTKALVQGIGFNKRQEAWTEEMLNNASITMQWRDLVSYNDKITVIQLVTNFSQTVYPVLRTSDDVLFSFTIYPILEIYEAYLFVSPDVALVRLIQYVDNLTPWDYKIVSNRVEFNTESENFIDNLDPQVSLRYTHHPVYYIHDIVREAFSTQSDGTCSQPGSVQPMPVKCTGRRAHYLPQANNYDGPKLYDNTNYAKFQ